MSIKVYGGQNLKKWDNELLKSGLKYDISDELREDIESELKRREK